MEHQAPMASEAASVGRGRGQAQPARGNPVARLPPRAVRWIKAVVFLAALLPLGRLVLGLFLRALGTNPVEVIIQSLGTWTLVFLCATLAVTPLRKITGWHWLVMLRRMLGLYAFFYAVLHFTSYVWLDRDLDVEAILHDIPKRPFITIGFACFVLLIPLALTSTNAMVRRLGAKRWLALHRLVYVIAVGGVIHYWWLVKRDITQPALYAALLAVLLGFRFVAYLRRRR
jgi:sulfoxide reductase heme-binding subunit YedZ